MSEVRSVLFIGKIIFLVLIQASLLSCTKHEKSADVTIYGVMDANIQTLDPIQAVDQYSAKIVAQIYEGLYHYNYQKRPLVVEPKLAEALPDLSEDGLTYTIKVRKNIYFQSDKAFGSKERKLTAYDFVYSWKRLADPKNVGQGWWVLDGKILGLNKWRELREKGLVDYQTPVPGLKAIDEYTLQIRLNQPSASFIYLLAMPPTFAVAREAVEFYGRDIVNHPIGTGPFVLDKWVRNSEVVLAKNPKYRETYMQNLTGLQKGLKESETKNEKLPLSDRVVIRIIKESQPIWFTFRKGGLDFGILPKDFYIDVYDNGHIKREIKKLGIKIHSQPSPDVSYLSINMEHPILGKNKFLRQAIAHAYDKASSLRMFYNGRGILAESVIPPGLPSYDPNYRNKVSFDLEKSRELLKKAGYPEGKGLPILNLELSNSNTWNRQMGEFLKDSFSKVGINLKIVLNTWPNFNKKIKSKQADLFQMAWTADYPDAQNLLQLFYSKNISPGPNNSNFSNIEFDKLYDKALGEKDVRERSKLYKKMALILNEEVPAIFLIHRVYKFPFYSWLSNYNDHPMIYDSYQYLKVDQRKRQKLKKAL